MASRATVTVVGASVAVGLGAFLGARMMGNAAGFPFYVMGEPTQPDGKECLLLFPEEDEQAEAACKADLERRRSRGMTIGAVTAGSLLGIAFLVGLPSFLD